MKFIEVASIFDVIEQESSRIEITKKLADLFKMATPLEASIISYMALGNLNPIYIGTQFNFASKSMLKVLAKYLQKSEYFIKQEYLKLGDFGLLLRDCSLKTSGEALTLIQVKEYILEFSLISGDHSVEKKEEKLLSLFNLLDPVSIKYVIRIILGKLRLGFSDMTLLDAFSWMYVGDKSIRKDLEKAYNICADIGMIILILKQDGLDKLNDGVITPGIPIRPASADRLPSARAIVEKLGECVAQPKLDGFRLQVHIDKTKGQPEVYFYSRNLQNMSLMFPDLKKAVLELEVESLIAEGEAIAFDIQTGTFLPFQETVKRKRKHNIESVAQDFPLKLYLFDILYLNGDSLLKKSHEDRRKALLTVVSTSESNDLIEKDDIVFAIEEKKIKTSEELESYFEENISQGLEGLVVKKIDAVYQAGKRNSNWVKLKRQETGQLDDTLDCVVLGYYAGKGRRARFGIGALLVGLYNKEKDCFQTVAKIGTGLTDDGFREIKVKCDRLKIDNKPKNVECSKNLYPDVWVSPEIVCLIRADEITLSPSHTAGKTETEDGLALRFPRFMGYRPDKSANESTTIKELKDLYAIQFEGKDKKTTQKRKKRASKKEEISKNILNIF